MYGLNAVAFVFFCGINLLAYRLSKAPEDVRSKTMLASQLPPESATLRAATTWTG